MLHRSGLCNLYCIHCYAIFIGQTDENFEIKYKKHLKAFRNKHPEKYNLAKHLLENIYLSYVYANFC